MCAARIYLGSTWFSIQPYQYPYSYTAGNTHTHTRKHTHKTFLPGGEHAQRWTNTFYIHHPHVLPCLRDGTLPCVPQLPSTVTHMLFIVQKCTLLRLRDDSLPEPENNIRNSWNKFFNWKLLFLGLRHVFIGFISQNNSAEKLLEWKMFYMFNFDCHKCISNLL